MASKQVIDKQKSADYVIALSESQMGVLTREFAQELGLSVKATKALLEATFARLAKERDALVKADSVLAGEEGDDADERAARDEARAATFSRVVRTRAALNGAYGPDVRADMFASGNTPEEPQALVRYGRQLADRMRSAKLPKPLEGMQIDTAALAKGLEEDCDALEKVLAAVSTETRETQVARDNRDQAMASFDRVFTAVTTQLEGYFWLIGKRDLAERVRPSQRRPGTTVNPPPVEG